MTFWMGLPNKRLKLAGGDRFKGSGELCPSGHGLSSNTLSPGGGSPSAYARSVWRRAAAPQTSVRQFLWYGEYARRRAPMLPREDRFAAPHTPQPRYGRPRRAPSGSGWLPTGNFPIQGRARAPSSARRAPASVPSAPSNTRLELAAPCCRGRIPFVTNQARRRSSSAIR